jgi:hypothetical protein
MFVELAIFSDRAALGMNGVKAARTDDSARVA